MLKKYSSVESRRKSGSGEMQERWVIETVGEIILMGGIWNEGDGQGDDSNEGVWTERTCKHLFFSNCNTYMQDNINPFQEDFMLTF